MDHYIEFLSDNLILSGSWAAIALVLVYSFISPLLSKFARVGNHQATLLINKQDATVLDVRPQKDFQKGHIIGSRQLKTEEIQKGDFTKLEKLKNAPIIVVCAMGNLASGTANKLVKQGFTNVSILSGGMSAWTGASLPLTTDTKPAKAKKSK